MASTLIKRTAENREFTISFESFAEIIAGETIASIVSIVSDPATGITIGTSSIASGNKKIKVWISGGSHNSIFSILAVVRTSAAKDIEEVATLFVTNDPIGSVS